MRMFPGGSLLVIDGSLTFHQNKKRTDRLPRSEILLGGLFALMFARDLKNTIKNPFKTLLNTKKCQRN